MRTYLIGSALCFLLLFSGCASTTPGSSNVTAEVPPPAGIGEVLQQSSQDWAQYVIDNQFVVVNNVWNKQAAVGTYKQDIFLKEFKGKKIFGWHWQGTSGKGVLAYPEVVYGPKPWDAPSSRKSEFPFAAGSKNVSVDFDIDVKAVGTYNMAFSLWVVSALPPRKETITHEIMIWNHNHGVAPYGDHEGTVEASGTTFDAYVRKAHGDDSGANANKWTYIAFIARKSVFQGSLETKPFVDFLLAKGVLTKKDFIANLELGNEIMDGEGVVEIRKFAVKAR